MKYKALFVGIDNYTHGIPALTCAQNDANALLAYFTKHGYKGDDDVAILRNGTTQQILDALEKQTQTLMPGDFFLFFFAGHGYTIDKPDGSCERRLAGAGDFLKRIHHGLDGITLSEIKDYADNAMCRFVVILDACQTKIKSTRAMTDADDSSKETCKARDLMAITSAVNRERKDDREEVPFLVINSCGENERAYELEKEKQGLFTLSMLKLFKKMEGDGKIPRFDDEFIKQIAEIMETRGKGYAQHPTMIASKNCDICNIPVFPQNDTGVITNVGEPYPAERLVLQFKETRLELYSKRNVTLGRESSRSDVVMQIPKGAVEEMKRKDWSQCISGRHAQLTVDEDAVVLTDLNSTNGTYVDKLKLRADEQDQKTIKIKSDKRIGFSSDVTWKMHIQTCAKKSKLPCCDGCNAQGVRSVVWEYPGWKASYKVFVWPCCSLKKVDPRLPDWRVIYQDGVQDAEGAFYLLTSERKVIYLQPGQKIAEGGVHVNVESSC